MLCTWLYGNLSISVVQYFYFTLSSCREHQFGERLACAVPVLFKSKQEGEGGGGCCMNIVCVEGDDMGIR